MRWDCYEAVLRLHDCWQLLTLPLQLVLFDFGTADAGVASLLDNQLKPSCCNSSYLPFVNEFLACAHCVLCYSHRRLNQCAVEVPCLTKCLGTLISNDIVPGQEESIGVREEIKRVAPKSSPCEGGPELVLQK